VQSRTGRVKPWNRYRARRFDQGKPTWENFDMVEDRRSLFVTGLKNAHAMENQAMSIIKPQLSRIENYPQVARRLEEHLRETETQMKRLEDILASLDEDHSSIKDWMLSAGGSMAAIGHSMADDEILKNSLANFAFENYEIAAYNSLMVMAEMGGFQASMASLRQNLSEEENMARWLSENLREVTAEFVTRREAGESAKV
jgi:ferritin-like metal-binding protein YciE